MKGGFQTSTSVRLLSNNQEAVTFTPAAGIEQIFKGEIPADMFTVGQKHRHVSRILVKASVTLNQAGSSLTAAQDDEIRSGILAWLEFQYANNIGVAFAREDYRGPLLENIYSVIDNGYQLPQWRCAAVAATANDYTRVYYFELRYLDSSNVDSIAACPMLRQMKDSLLTALIQPAGTVIHTGLTLKAATSVTLRAKFDTFVPHSGSKQIPMPFAWKRYEVPYSGENIVVENFTKKGKGDSRRKPGARVSHMYWLPAIFGMNGRFTGLTFDALTKIAIPFRSLPETIYTDDPVKQYLDGLPHRVGGVGSIGANPMEDSYQWPYKDGTGPTDGAVLTSGLKLYPIIGTGRGWDMSRLQKFDGTHNPSWSVGYTEGTAPNGHVVVAKEHYALTKEAIYEIADFCEFTASEKARLRLVAPDGRDFALDDEDGFGHPARVMNPR